MGDGLLALAVLAANQAAAGSVQTHPGQSIDGTRSIGGSCQQESWSVETGHSQNRGMVKVLFERRSAK